MLEQLHVTTRALGGSMFHLAMSAFEIDERSGEIACAFAGAPPAFVRKRGGRVDVVGGTGTPLGGKDFGLFQTRLELERGDVLLTFTDGCSELPLEDGRQLGLRRLRKMFANVAARTVDGYRGELQARLEGYVGERPQDDDMTLVLVGHR